MKRFIILAGILFFSRTSLKAQLFDALFERAKNELNRVVENNANKFLSNSIEMIEGQAGKLVELSTKSKKKSIGGASNEYVASSTDKIQMNEIEKMLSRNYPFFYEVYQDALSDPLVDKVSFVVRDQHNELCNIIMPGTLVFDIYFFENKNNKNESVNTWVLLVQWGRLHYVTKHSQNFKKSTEEWEYAFRFALEKAYKYAKNRKCIPAKHAVEVWSKNSFGKDMNRKIARDNIIKTEFYSNILATYSRKCK